MARGWASCFYAYLGRNRGGGWRAFNVVVANCRFYGGGMHISPKSDPGDCLLDVLVMTGPKSDAFTTLPKVYKGAHLPHRARAACP